LIFKTLAVSFQIYILFEKILPEIFLQQQFRHRFPFVSDVCSSNHDSFILTKYCLLEKCVMCRFMQGSSPSEISVVEDEFKWVLSLDV